MLAETRSEHDQKHELEKRTPKYARKVARVVESLDNVPPHLFEEPAFGAPWKKESLPFVVRIARTRDVAERANTTRYEANLRHETGAEKTALDWDEDDEGSATVVICAINKADGRVLASLRVQGNHLGEEDEPIPGLLKMFPIGWRNVPSIVVSKFAAVTGGEGRLATLGICKGMYLYAVAKQARTVLVAAEVPRDKLFERMGFRKVCKEDILFPHYVHRHMKASLLACNLEDFVIEAKKRTNPLFSFGVETHHEAIKLFASVAGPGNDRRISDIQRSGFIQGSSFRFDLPVV